VRLVFGLRPRAAMSDTRQTAQLNVTNIDRPVSRTEDGGLSAIRVPSRKGTLQLTSRIQSHPR
jgi:hypothetical protein